MAKWRQKSTAEQLADYFREGIRTGRWEGKMPGVMRLASELGVARDSVEGALRELEKEGLLRALGPGLGRAIDLVGRAIDLNDGSDRLRGVRVGILAYEPSDKVATDTVELLNDLDEAGHVAVLSDRTMKDFGHQVGRIARVVEATRVDAWIVMSGSREVLSWFAGRDLPTFAYAGRASRLPIASIAPEKIGPLRMLVRRLVELGHQRIVLLVRGDRRKPEPGRFERAFLEALEENGISTGSYNLPDWVETPAGYGAALESLFRVAPPTAIIVDEVPFVVTTLQFCLARGLKIPRDLSLIGLDPGPSLDWSWPAIAHVAWDHRPCVRRMVGWANNIAAGKDDRRQSFSKAVLVEGGTIGPAPR